MKIPSMPEQCLFPLFLFIIIFKRKGRGRNAMGVDRQEVINRKYEKSTRTRLPPVLI